MATARQYTQHWVPPPPPLRTEHSPPQSGIRQTSGRSDYRTVDTRHPSPPPPRRTLSATYIHDHSRRRLVPDDVESATTEDSREDRGHVEVRTFRGLDEDGKPTTFFEERRTRYLPAGGRGRKISFEKQVDRNMMPGSWREV